MNREKLRRGMDFNEMFVQSKRSKKARRFNFFRHEKTGMNKRTVKGNKERKNPTQVKGELTG